MKKGWLRKLLFLATLEMGALIGIPIRPDEIEKLMRNMHQPKIERVNPDKGEKE